MSEVTFKKPDWISSVPKDWNTLPFLSCVSENTKRNSDGDMTVLSLSYGKVILKDLDAGGLSPESYSTYQVLQPDDIVMRLTDLQNDHTSLRTGYVTQPGVITSAYLGLKVNKQIIIPIYFHWLLHTYDIQKVFYGMGGGVRQSIGYPELKWMSILIPPLETQKRIADFLDAKTKTVDELIAKKEQLIELLKEKRAAIITQAVTKGIDPKVKLKPSGIEWLGDIPEHWGTQPARALLRDRREKNKKLVSDNILSVMRGVGVIRYADKGNVGNKSSDNPENYKIVYPGDIVINSMNLVIGSVGISREFGVTSNVYIIYREVEGMSLTDYYHNVFLIEGLQRHLGKFGKGIMELREAVKHGDIKNQLFPHPPLKEQREIADFLQKMMTKINSATSLAESQVEKLKEYRSSLIYSAVTGKIDI